MRSNIRIHPGSQVLVDGLHHVLRHVGLVQRHRPVELCNHPFGTVVIVTRQHVDFVVEWIICEQRKKTTYIASFTIAMSLILIMRRTL